MTKAFFHNSTVVRLGIQHLYQKPVGHSKTALSYQTLRRLENALGKPQTTLTKKTDLENELWDALERFDKVEEFLDDLIAVGDIWSGGARSLRWLRQRIQDDVQNSEPLNTVVPFPHALRSQTHEEHIEAGRLVVEILNAVKTAEQNTPQHRHNLSLFFEHVDVGGWDHLLLCLGGSQQALKLPEPSEGPTGVNLTRRPAFLPLSAHTRMLLSKHSLSHDPEVWADVLLTLAPLHSFENDPPQHKLNRRRHERATNTLKPFCTEFQS